MIKIINLTFAPIAIYARDFLGTAHICLEEIQVFSVLINQTLTCILMQ